jgi:signal transduction histidine kinase
MGLSTFNVVTRATGDIRAYLRFGWPILSLIALIGVSVFALLADIARGQDETYARSSRDFVKQATQNWVKTNAKISNEYSLWTDAYEKVTLSFDQSWLEANFLSESISAGAIVRLGKGLRFTYVNPNIEVHADALKEALQAFDLSSHADYQAAPSARTLQISPNGLFVIDGSLAAVAGQPIRPDNSYAGTLPNAQQSVDIAVIATFIDKSAVDELAQSFGLVDAKLRIGNRPTNQANDKIYFDIADGAGNKLGWIEWKNLKPGSAAFEQRFWPILLGLLLVGLGTLIVTDMLTAAQVRLADTARVAAEEASQTKSSFLANVSHELRTPLNAIIGYSELIKEDCIDAGVAQSVKDSDKVIGSAQHLLGLINDLLDHSKIEAGKMDLNPTLTELGPLFGDVSDALQTQIAKANNRFVLNVDPQIGAAMIDGMRLKQCLLNLVSNAAKFTRGGTVSLFARPVDRDGVAFVRIAVKDEGIGMSEATVAKLFAPFVQADATTASKFGGTGLGLVITRALVEAMGGTITVESEVGKGSTFTILVPRGLAALAMQVDPAKAA